MLGLKQLAELSRILMHLELAWLWISQKHFEPISSYRFYLTDMKFAAQHHHTALHKWSSQIFEVLRAEPTVHKNVSLKKIATLYVFRLFTDHKK